MLVILHSVGVKGKNRKPDVTKIQKALNKIKSPFITEKLVEDGLFGSKTGEAITRFQQKHVFLLKPDGRIDPGGKTIQKLAAMAIETLAPQRVLFPLKTKPSESYKTGIRAYGSNRSKGKRKHAGVDLYAPKGTEIRAMKDGKVIQSYTFYLGTKALEIDHGDMIIRYGEISKVADGIKAGVSVKRGQVIAYVGELNFKSGNKMSMLHLEAYKGNGTGSLTVRSATPYQRRSDLFDPTQLLDSAAMN
jgi:murein DD-endopeptidase MepM/ murein hydrolase activator NlpD